MQSKDADTQATGSILERRLGPIDAAAIIVANVIGGGILFTPPQVAAAVPNAWLFLLTWLLGGLLAFVGAMAYAELAALRPRAGGEYVYLREAYGPLAGFLTGWTSFVAGFSGAIATSAVIFASYLGRFIPFAGNTDPFVSLVLIPGVFSVSVSPQVIVSITLVIGMAWIHIRGVGPGRLVGNLLAALKVSSFIIFIAIGFSFGLGNIEHFTATAPVRPVNWLAALIPVMFTYSGWNAAAYVAEEIRDPGRNVPRALALGTGAVIAIYLALNALYIYVVPIEQLATVDVSILDFIADRMLGSAAGNVMAVIALISLSASISAMTFAGPRVYFAMARDKVFVRSASRVHSRYRTPAIAIIAQAVWSSFLIMSAQADTLVTYTGFSIVLFSAIAVTAVFVLRAREPKAERPFLALGHPFLTALYVLVSTLILLNGLINNPGPTGAGVLVILAGVPLYFLFRRTRPVGSTD